MTTYFRNLLWHFLVFERNFWSVIFVVMLCKVWQINVLYFVAVQFIAKLLMFYKVRQKTTKKLRRMGLKYSRRSANMGRLFAPWQGSSNKNAVDFRHRSPQWLMVDHCILNGSKASKCLMQICITSWIYWDFIVEFLTSFI